MISNISQNRTRDFATEAARGLISGVSIVNKFGYAPNGIQTTATDIWSRANATPTQQIWLAPTAARIHAIVSTSTNDDGNPVGTGARTLRIYGLKTWDLAETSEDITLDGTTPVNTVNSYVIIHRMKVLTCGGNNNLGTITATAATAKFQIRANETPNIQTTCYLRKNDMSVQSTGSSSKDKYFSSPIKFAGPCIIKIQAIGSAADIEGQSGFDGYLINN